MSSPTRNGSSAPGSFGPIGPPGGNQRNDTAAQAFALPDLFGPARPSPQAPIAPPNNGQREQSAAQVFATPDLFGALRPSFGPAFGQPLPPPSSPPVSLLSPPLTSSTSAMPPPSASNPPPFSWSAMVAATSSLPPPPSASGSSGPTPRQQRAQGIVESTNTAFASGKGTPSATPVAGAWVTNHYHRRTYSVGTLQEAANQWSAQSPAHTARTAHLSDDNNQGPYINLERTDPHPSGTGLPTRHNMHVGEKKFR